MRTILTILLTSLCWALVITVFFEPRHREEEPVVAPVEVVEVEKPTKPTRSERKSERTERKVAKKAEPKSEPKSEPKPTPAPAKVTSASDKTTQTKQEVDYSELIDGKWQPVEGAEYPLEFTKYGIAIQYRGYDNRMKYSLSDKRLNIKYDKARCEIGKVDGEYILEIYNSEEFSGKYKRVYQPRKIAMRLLDESSYIENIVGKWSPINGQEHPIEFSKYGTAIQKRGFDNRVEYSLNGSSLKIKYDNARVAISEDASYYYLEIYNSEDFSGRYRRSK